MIIKLRNWGRKLRIMLSIISKRERELKHRRLNDEIRHRKKKKKEKI
jgi:hypothetical protein